ncbi:MAG: carotenoid biosynthesis protein [Kineosporiaceae bacterium]
MAATEVLAGPPPDRPAAPVRRRLPGGPALVLAALAVLAQVVHPLVAGRALTWLTILSVLLFAAASTAHAARWTGARGASALLVVAGGVGLLAEMVGTATGFPFGRYVYTGTLGWELGTVPVIIGAAWAMMAWPALVAGRLLARRRPGWRRRAEVVVLGAAVLASWDLFLDPQMTAAGHWRFLDPAPGLPGVPGIPLTNYAGWVLVALVMIAVLEITVPEPRRPVGQAVPALLLGWTWLGSVVANLVFFDRPAVALWGGVGMGLVVAPYLLRVRREHRRPPSP